MEEAAAAETVVDASTVDADVADAGVLEEASTAEEAGAPSEQVRGASLLSHAAAHTFTLGVP